MLSAGIAYANSLDPGQSQQIVGLEKRFKLFDNLKKDV